MLGEQVIGSFFWAVKVALELFVKGWVYCITIGRGAPILSRYIDSISNTYLKQLTKKQIKLLKKQNYSKANRVKNAIKNGMDEISNQYTRILKHLRIHSEIFLNPKILNHLQINFNYFLISGKRMN